MNCKSCMYYRANMVGEQQSQIGYCYSRPPVVVTIPMAAPAKVKSRFSQPEVEPGVVVQPASVRPLVQESDFCAEFKSPVTH